MGPISMRNLDSTVDSESGWSETVTTSEESLNLEFTDFIQRSCKIFSCPISVVVSKAIQQDFRGLKQKQETKNRRKSINPNISDSPKELKIIAGKLKPTNEETLVVMAFYDILNRLIEILMFKYQYQPIPRTLMKLIALIVPYNRYLTKFTIKHCRINMYTIHELSKILPLTNITDVCLDQSPLAEGNYDILLSDVSSLQNLSLSRCKINDIICRRIAARLHYLEPAESTLLALNISSNYITDKGAQYLGEALRSNRHLIYLNIADNHIGDDGARYIFDVLTEFPLTCEEAQDTRNRHLQYLKKMRTLYYSCVDKLSIKPEENSSSKKTATKSTAGKTPSVKKEKNKHSMSDQGIRNKAEMMAKELLGPFKDPFSSSRVPMKNGQTYSIGNLVLCYLNIAYNNLTYQSIQKLLAVVLNQHKHRDDNARGLLNILLDGNYIPENCVELKSIDNELLKYIVNFSGGKKKIMTTGDKKQVPSGK